MSKQPSYLPGAQNRLTAYCSEQETEAYSRLELPVVRYLAEAGVISGVQVVGKEEHCYEASDLVLLRRVRRLYQDLGVNLEGIEIILRLTARIEILQREVAHYQAMAERSAGEAQADDNALNQPGTEEQEL